MIWVGVVGGSNGRFHTRIGVWYALRRGTGSARKRRTVSKRQNKRQRRSIVSIKPANRRHQIPPTCPFFFAWGALSALPATRCIERLLAQRLLLCSARRKVAAHHRLLHVLHVRPLPLQARSAAAKKAIGRGARKRDQLVPGLGGAPGRVSKRHRDSNQMKPNATLARGREKGMRRHMRASSKYQGGASQPQVDA